MPKQQLLSKLIYQFLSSVLPVSIPTLDRGQRRCDERMRFETPLPPGHVQRLESIDIIRNCTPFIISHFRNLFRNEKGFQWSKSFGCSPTSESIGCWPVKLQMTDWVKLFSRFSYCPRLGLEQQFFEGTNQIEHIVEEAITFCNGELYKIGNSVNLFMLLLRPPGTAKKILTWSTANTGWKNDHKPRCSYLVLMYIRPGPPTLTDSQLH